MPSAPIPASDADSAELTVLAFSDEEEHCTYDGAAILSSLAPDELAVINAVFPDASSWSTSVDLYCASEELEELGHEELSTVIYQFIHAEQIFECICRTEAFETFKSTVAAAAAAVEKQYPHCTWAAPDHVHAIGLDVDMMLTDLGLSDTKPHPVTFTFDDRGNITVTADGRELKARAFITPEEGTFAQYLDAGDVYATTGAGYGVASIDDWLELPEVERLLVARLYFHDLAVEQPDIGPGEMRRSRDLAFDQLRSTARKLIAKPEPVRVMVTDLMPNAEGTLEELIAAVEAAFIPA